MARRPKANVKQLDLFAAPVAAAGRAHVAAMEPRGSIAGVVLTPPLTAEAAILAHGSPVEHTGYRWQDGTSCCLACFPTYERAKLDRGHGYRMSTYRAGFTKLARCVACGVPFNGETGAEELQRRHQTVDGQSPPQSAAEAQART